MMESLFSSSHYGWALFVGYLVFEKLLKASFAFDPNVFEEAKRYGKLTVLTVLMNPDLTMGDELEGMRSPIEQLFDISMYYFLNKKHK
jgi:hypothetical protein